MAKILLIEDEKNNQQMFRRLFSGEHDLAIVSTISEAQEHIADQIPDLIVADWRLEDTYPMHLGIEIAPEALACDVPLIIWSADNAGVIESAALGDGCDRSGVEIDHRWIRAALALQENDQLAFVEKNGIDDILETVTSMISEWVR